MMVAVKLAEADRCSASGKVRYSTRSIARRMRKILGGCYRKSYRCYRCPLCESYHLATKHPFTQGA
jgi:hypothetical protein